MKSTIISALLCCIISTAFGQSHASFADSLRKAYSIPELAYAVVSANEVLDVGISGTTNVKWGRAADINDRFRIGSNTKTITSFIAARMVKAGQIKWDTKLFDLFPELKQTGSSEYDHTTLIELLSFRSKLLSWTYTNETPLAEQFTGDEERQRYQFVQWALGQPPTKREKGFGSSNPGYAAAGLMLQRASGKPYKQLVQEVGKMLDIDFGFGAPNALDYKQPWGHDADLKPEAPADNHKLNWLLPAGNINMSMPDYAKFIQLQLQGLQGKSALLTKEGFEYLHFGLPEFAVGWFWKKENGHKVSYHLGNPGTFLAKVYIDKDADRAYILFANVQSDGATEAFDVLLTQLITDQETR